MTKNQQFEEKPAPSYKSDKPHYTGHRQRLRNRLVNKGAVALADYELLEMILFRVFPRKDTKPVAKKLIEHFGDFASVLSAPPHLLKEVDGIGEKAISELKLITACMERFSTTELQEKPLLDSWSKVIDYCQITMAYKNIEQFRILFLDKKNRLIKDEVLQQGTIDHTPVYPREIVKRGLELSATALILVHNHPSGDPTPSSADVQMTKKIIEACDPVGILIHDHIIIGKEGHASLRGLDLI